ncbi:hypothetical protein P7K49_015986, partial [Saguinus oedipus]
YTLPAICTHCHQVAVESQAAFGSQAMAKRISIFGRRLKMDFYLLNQFNEINLLTTLNFKHAKCHGS